jgi:hypothetical protein
MTANGGQTMRRRQQPRRKFPIPSAGEWPKPQDRFNLKDVLAASLISFGVIAEVRRIEAQLLSDEGAERSGWLLTLLKYPPWKAQRAKHERKAKTVRIAAATIDEREILRAQGVVAHHPSFIGYGSVETEPLRCGEQFSVWHGCPW